MRNRYLYPPVSLAADSPLGKGALVMRNRYPYPPVTFGDSPLVGALRKHAGGMFLATDRSGYAARREDVGVLGRARCPHRAA